jgi:hypothetical protein
VWLVGFAVKSGSLYAAFQAFMKLKTATLLAIIGTAVVLAGNIINSTYHVMVAGQLPPYYLLAIGPSFVFGVCLLIFFVTLYRNQ